MSQGKLLHVIERIYDAALEPSLWPGALAQIADHLGAASCHFLLHDVSNGTPVLHVARTDPLHIQEYFAHYAQKNPWIPPFTSLPSGTVTPDYQVFPREELERSEFFNEHLRERNVAHCLGMLVLKSPSVLSAMMAYRTEDGGAFDGRAVEIGRQLVPHFQRAVHIGQKLLLQEGRADGALAALARVPYGVVFLNHAGKIIHMNRHAGEILDQKDGLSIIARELCAASSRESQVIKRHVSAAVRMAGLPAGALSVPRPSGRRPFELLVSPIQTERSGLFGDLTPRAVMFMTDPERDGKTPIGVLQRLYGLTKRESAVAAMAVQGHGLSHVAEVLGISLETVRSHLKRVMEKTGTSRQAELVRLVLSGAARLSVSDSKHQG